MAFYQERQWWSEGGSQDCDITAVAMCWEWVPYWAGWAVHCHHAPKISRYFLTFLDALGCVALHQKPFFALDQRPSSFSIWTESHFVFAFNCGLSTCNVWTISHLVFVSFSIFSWSWIFNVWEKNQENYSGNRFRLCSGVWHLPHLKSLKSFLETKKEEKPFVLVLMLACFTD